jgi:two-component system, NarL family, invasion response regulator UvrY
MPSRQLRILIADDHAVLRAGLRRLLQDVPGVGEVGEAETATHARQALRSAHWDILVLDLDMPGQSPLDVLKSLKADHPDVAVLIHPIGWTISSTCSRNCAETIPSRTTG